MPALEKSRCQASSQDVVFTENAQVTHSLCTGARNSQGHAPLKCIFQPLAQVPIGSDALSRKFLEIKEP
jgi:hypothetical protein